jgi:hypothetical protein
MTSRSGPVPDGKRPAIRRGTRSAADGRHDPALLAANGEPVPRPVHHGRSALYIGFFSAFWFNWARAGAPADLVPMIVACVVLALMVAVLGGVLLIAVRRRRWARNAAVDRRFVLIAAVQFVAIAAGAILLSQVGHPELVPPWTAAIVGAHFLPLARLLWDPALVWLGIATIAVSVAGTVIAMIHGAATTVTGLAVGVALLGFAVRGLFRGWSLRWSPEQRSLD